jgi:hypothetical protein
VHGCAGGASELEPAGFTDSESFPELHTQSFPACAAAVAAITATVTGMAHDATDSHDQFYLILVKPSSESQARVNFRRFHHDCQLIPPFTRSSAVG